MVTHRYVGIVMGLLMLLWFLSGIGMLFIHWPELGEADRAAGLPPVAWETCCNVGLVQDVQQVTSATVEDLAGRPVLRFDGETLDLATGELLHHVTVAQAAIVAQGYAHTHGLHGTPGMPQRMERDQWTVTGYFNKKRPFLLFHFNDWRRTDIYVSEHTGQVAQVVNRWDRFLNWLGPIPHWLYPTVLRADTKLWTQVVVWTSLVGTFLTLTGLYLGIVAWRPWRDRRLTPFRGLMAWHHLGGLAAGLLTLTWVASGLVSMNPWGLLEGGDDPRAAPAAFGFGDLRQAVLAAKAAGVTARQLKAAPFDGRVYLMADGVRLDAAAKPAPLALGDLAAAAKKTLGPIQSAGLLRREDQYYRGHHEPVALPVYRVIAKDGTRFYLDPKSGRLLGAMDANSRGYRWLFEGLHRLDFIDGFDRGGGWATTMVGLLALAGLGVATGVWLGWRRASSDLSGLFKRKAPKLG